MLQKKTYIDANQLLQDAYELALQVYDSGFEPNLIVGVWRGGAPIAIAMQELMQLLGINPDHIAIRTSHYTGINQTADAVRVEGLNYVLNNVNDTSRVLLVDDVFDSGRSMEQILRDIQLHCGDKSPIVKIATAYFKPTNNKTTLLPDYFIHQCNEWLVFPHELNGLTTTEIAQDKPGLGKFRQRIVELHQAKKPHN